MAKTAIHLRVFVFVSAIVFGHTPTALAENAQPDSPAEDEDWHPTAEEGTADWIQLTSGEWLRGNIDRMRDESLQFDSDKLDDLNIDWEDIKGIYANSVNRYVLEDDTVLAGLATLEDGRLTVQTDSGPTTVNASELVAILEGTPTERNRWEFKLSLGFTAQFGTSPQLITSMGSTIIREDADTRMELDYTGSYGRSQGDLTVNNHWGSGRFDWYTTRYFFINLVQGSIGHDQFRNLRLQGNIGSGLGYTIFDTKRVDWSIEATAAYAYTAYNSVQAGEDDSDDGAAIIPASNLDIELTKDIDFGVSSRNTLVVTNFDLSYFHTTGYLEIEINDTFDFNVTVTWDRTRVPVAIEDGSEPSRDSVQLIVGIDLNF